MRLQIALFLCANALTSTYGYQNVEHMTMTEPEDVHCSQYFKQFLNFKSEHNKRYVNLHGNICMRRAIIQNNSQD